MEKVSIIGFGNFGRLVAKHLAKKMQVVVTDIADQAEVARRLGVKFVSLDEAMKNKIIILAVPMENLEETLEKLKHKLSAGSLVIDVCSLKVFSTKLMKKILPSHVEIIGTHPLFGPNSTPNGIGGMKIALCQVRSKEETFERVKRFSVGLGLQVFVTSPEDHDRQMASSQALTHFVGQVAKRMNLERVNLSTKTFDDLMDIMDVIKNDTPKLFNNMQQINPFAEEVRNDFIENSLELNDELKVR